MQFLVPKKAYRGLNRLVHHFNMVKNNFPTPYYATFSQISQIGGRFIKGAWSTCVYYFKYELKNILSNEKITLYAYNILSNEQQKLSYVCNSLNLVYQNNKKERTKMSRIR